MGDVRETEGLISRSKPAMGRRIKGKPRSRTFAIGNWTFRCLHTRVWDVVLDGVQSFFEGVVLLLGPVLIMLALGITTMLSYTFFDILVPMMLEKHQDWNFKWSWIGVHGTWVVFLLINILFNYFMCVVTRNSGPKYDRVVREMAAVTGFRFPETQAEVDEYRLEYEDRMSLRVRRRREREIERREGQHASSNNGLVPSTVSDEDSKDVSLNASTTDSGSSVTHRKQSRPSQNPGEAQKAAPTPSTTVRRWMLMGPFEWGFCHNSKQPKPPRSHYDHVTKRLVLNLDH